MASIALSLWTTSDLDISRKLNSLCEHVDASVKASSQNLTELQQEADKINRQLDEPLARKVTQKMSSNL